MSLCWTCAEGFGAKACGSQQAEPWGSPARTRRRQNCQQSGRRRAWLPSACACSWAVLPSPPSPPGLSLQPLVPACAVPGASIAQESHTQWSPLQLQVQIPHRALNKSLPGAPQTTDAESLGQGIGVRIARTCQGIQGAIEVEHQRGQRLWLNIRISQGLLKLPVLESNLD